MHPKIIQCHVVSLAICADYAAQSQPLFAFDRDRFVVLQSTR